MSKVLTAGAFEFTPLYDSGAEFLTGILDADHIVRLTYAATDGKDHVTCMAGPLEKCCDCIKAYKFRDRYVQVRLMVAGQEKTVRRGIILNDDVRRETANGKVEAHIPILAEYTFVNGKPAVMLQFGDCVAVISCVFVGNIAVIREVGTGTGSITVHIFDREIPVEVSAEEVRKLEPETDSSAG